AAGIVGDHGVADPVLPELPGRQRSALVARPRLVDPHMERDTLVVRNVDWRQSSAEVDGGQPAGVAVRKHLDRPLLLRGNRADELGAMAADSSVDGDILIADLARAAIGLSN